MAPRALQRGLGESIPTVYRLPNTVTRWTNKRPCSLNGFKLKVLFRAEVRLKAALAHGASDAWSDNKVRAFFAWLFQSLFRTRARWTNCTAVGKTKTPFAGLL